MISHERLAEIRRLASLVSRPALNVAEAEALIKAVPELLAEVERLWPQLDTCEAVLADAENERDMQSAEVKRLRTDRFAIAKHTAQMGLERGLRGYAWWKDGVQYVGAGRMTLAEALRSADGEVLTIAQQVSEEAYRHDDDNS